MRTPTRTSNSVFRRHALALMAGSAVLLGTGFAWWNTARAAEAAVKIPPPAQDMPLAEQGPQKAVFAGGCFWGVQGVFQHVKGVQRAVSGYAGGAAPATYEMVSRGNTGHAESVEITYDPAQISYGTLLQIFFSVAHDPTQLNRQGPDTGTQYRSAILPANAAQSKVAQAYITQLNTTKLFGKPIATRIEEKASFYPAEAYHQDYLTENPRNPYIVINDLPKVENLQRLFPDRYRSEPVLVKSRG